MFRTSALLLAASTMALTACSSMIRTPDLSTMEPTTMTMQPGPDPHSYAQPAEARVRHLSLDLSVDFTAKQLSGAATLDIEARPDASQLILDTRDLTIGAVSVDGKPVQARLSSPVQYLGSALVVPISGSSKQVRVEYRTSPQAAALQWLDPSQTAGGKLPFLFTQSQAILARTWAPVQDTPSVRMTYDATIRVPKEMIAVMSAENPTARNAEGVYRFSMPQPIPSYLLALAVGDIGFRALDERSGVYAEPAVLQSAASELVDTPKMIDEAEKLYGPYRWGRYDLLILPPSFPFGGMENPRLTFATPTILAGDRSLVSLVAHELAHSWSGNLVTNATWNDFWLNEGFTVYFEQRIMESVFGRDVAEMNASLGMDDLRSTIADLGATSKDTQLKLDLAGRDPDEGVNDIAYQKGYFLLRLLEEQVGRPRFDQFLRQWFASHSFQSMTTEQFVDYAMRNLVADRPDLQRSVREWIYSPGLPANAPVVRAVRFEEVDAEAKRFLTGTAPSALNTSGWTTQQWLRFLQTLPADLPRTRLAELDAAFHFTQSGNAPLVSAWLVHAIQAGYSEAYPTLERYLTHVGRRLLIKPLYVEMMKTPEGGAMAKRIYAQARSGYHAVSRQTLDKIVNP